ncbi:unnamed protein product [Soboliphyme baturini]|uniref:Uncharacterized protein n=1 Tax=Soboliphyme baturini TaxID=241478 RepID=A0A183IXC2_9BILA|nr:unnamed protein product [Soboliphyme baturini]
MPWDSFRKKKEVSSRKRDEAVTGCFAKGSSLESHALGLPKEVYQKIKEVDQQASTLSTANHPGLSARIVDNTQNNGVQAETVWPSTVTAVGDMNMCCFGEHYDACVAGVYPPTTGL